MYSEKIVKSLPNLKKVAIIDLKLNIENTCKSIWEDMFKVTNIKLKQTQLWPFNRGLEC